jgi:hypothetical protein
MCKELEENRKAVAHLELDQAIKGDPTCGAALALKASFLGTGLEYLVGTAFDYRDEDEADDYRPF